MATMSTQETGSGGATLSLSTVAIIRGNGEAILFLGSYQVIVGVNTSGADAPSVSCSLGFSPVGDLPDDVRRRSMLSATPAAGQDNHQDDQDRGHAQRHND